MKKALSILPEDIRRVRRSLDETQAQFAKRLGVDPVTVARWETGQRKCTGIYALGVARVDPDGRLSQPILPGGRSVSREEAKLSALAHLVRAFFDGSTAKAVSALVTREALSDEDLATLARVIEQKRKGKEANR